MTKPYDVCVLTEFSVGSSNCSTVWRILQNTDAHAKLICTVNDLMQYASFMLAVPKQCLAVDKQVDCVVKPSLHIIRGPCMSCFTAVYNKVFLPRSHKYKLTKTTRRPHRKCSSCKPILKRTLVRDDEKRDISTG